MPREAASSWFGEEDRGLHQCIRASLWCCCVGEEEEEGKTSLWCCCAGAVAVLGKKKKIEARCCWERRRNRGQEVRAT